MFSSHEEPGDQVSQVPRSEPARSSPGGLLRPPNGPAAAARVSADKPRGAGRCCGPGCGLASRGRLGGGRRDTNLTGPNPAGRLAGRWPARPTAGTARRPSRHRAGSGRYRRTCGQVSSFVFPLRYFSRRLGRLKMGLCSKTSLPSTRRARTRRTRALSPMRPYTCDARLPCPRGALGTRSLGS